MSLQTRGIFGLNIVLLFLVVLEPYLLTIINMRAGGIAYALDVGSTLLILGYFARSSLKHLLGSENPEVDALRRRYHYFVVTGLVFFLTIIPIQVLPLPDGVNISGAIWLGILVLGAVARTTGTMKMNY